MKKIFLFKTIACFLVLTFPTMVFAQTRSIYGLQIDMLQVIDQILQCGEDGELTSADIAGLKNRSLLYTKEFLKMIRSGDRSKLQISREQLEELKTHFSLSLQRAFNIQNNFDVVGGFGFISVNPAVYIWLVFMLIWVPFELLWWILANPLEPVPSE